MVLFRFLRFSVFLYLSFSVLYTTNYYLISPLRSCFSLFFSLEHTPPDNPSWPTLPFQIFHDPSAPGPDPTDWFSLPAKDIMDRHTSGFILERDSEERATISEDLFLSKAFAQSMRPSKIIPFFYRATGAFDEADITITTLVTGNRYKVFAKLVERYQGPISVTVHLKNTTSRPALHALLNALHNMYTSSPAMSRYVDVHLVIDSFDRQFNTWRNIARLFARTEFVMMLDVDFAVCTDFRGALMQNRAVMDKLRGGDAAFVVPAFEYARHSEGVDQVTFPRDKARLLALVKADRIGMFHATWVMGHNSTDYDRYYAAEPGEIYKVTRYQSAYEPYVIIKKEGPPWCDERFVGYGGNKAACLFEIYLSGVSFYVLADHFVVHQNHVYEEVARKNERKLNRKIYADFKEETCLRYIKSYYDNGLLNTSRGYNMQDECKKIKGVSRIAAQLIGV